MNPSSVILLVEHDKDYIYLLEQAFRQADIRSPLKTARYGNEAILYLRGVGIYADRNNFPLPRLILLDMTNPDSSSLAVLDWVREQIQFAHLPILILAPAGEDSEMEQAFYRGANVFRVERENLAELIAMIHSIELLSESRAFPPPHPFLPGSEARS